jgi:MFS-type transporter involved in bile tolerance (Atg22 family)
MVCFRYISVNTLRKGDDVIIIIIIIIITIIIIPLLCFTHDGASISEREGIFIFAMPFRTALGPAQSQVQWVFLGGGKYLFFPRNKARG